MKEFVEYGGLYLLVHFFLFCNSHQSGGIVFSSHDSNFTFFFLYLLFEIEQMRMNNSNQGLSQLLIVALILTKK